MVYTAPHIDKKINLNPINSLTPYTGNARTHSRKQIAQIAASIETFGWTNPILIDESRTIIAGHGRLETARQLGLDTVPTLQINHLSEDEKRAYVIADNRIAELAGWDEDTLKIEFAALTELDLEFDISTTGFEMPAIDLLLSDPDADQEEEPPVPALDGSPVSEAGDLWCMGEHKLFCGSALEIESYQTLMGSEKSQLVITDPPYNVPIGGHVSGLGTIKHDEFVMATGELSEDEFKSFLETTLDLVTQHSASGSLHYIFMDWRHIADLIEIGNALYDKFKNLCVWTKTNPGMGSFYRSQHELVALFKWGTSRHINNIELGRHGRNRSNVWPYAGATAFGGDRNDTLAMHPTVKPTAMIRDAILDASNRGGVVLDPFAGSGTTMIAAEQSGRRARLMELDPKYVDVAINRFEDMFGVKAVHQQSGLTFGALNAERSSIQRGRRHGS